MRVPLLVVLVLTGCDQLYLEAQVPALCQHLDHQSFAIPAELRARYEQLPVEMRTGLELARTFDFDVKMQVPPELQHLESRFALSSVTVTAVDGTPDLGFVEAASVSLQGPDDSSLAPHTFSYQRTEAAPKRVLWRGEDFDLSPYLQTGTLRYAVSMTGTLPEKDVVVDIDACASASVKVNYLQQ